jgi:TrmH RNA methyltransferase
MRAANEMRVFGLNACLAVFAHRPQAIRKVYLLKSRLDLFREALAWCAQHRIGYRLVEKIDLEKLTQSEHHEGVCFEVRQSHQMGLSEFLDATKNNDQPVLTLWLEGVGNPHNFGAVLRSAAHFGVAAVLLTAKAGLSLSGAACRVAEGGAEVVPLVSLEEPRQSIMYLQQAGFKVLATRVRDGKSLYAQVLPKRLVIVFGAEDKGLSSSMLEALPEAISIPGSGLVDSLNIAASASVIMSEFFRQHS